MKPTLMGKTHAENELTKSCVPVVVEEWRQNKCSLHVHSSNDAFLEASVLIVGSIRQDWQQKAGLLNGSTRLVGGES